MITLSTILSLAVEGNKIETRAYSGKTNPLAKRQLIKEVKQLLIIESKALYKYIILGDREIPKQQSINTNIDGSAHNRLQNSIRCIIKKTTTLQPRRVVPELVWLVFQLSDLQYIQLAVLTKQLNKHSLQVVTNICCWGCE